jgi:hypothetical protein
MEHIKALSECISPRGFHAVAQKAAISQRWSKPMPVKGACCAASMPQSFIAKYERGERRLDVVEFVAITRAIGADPLQILRALLKSRT